MKKNSNNVSHSKTNVIPGTLCHSRPDRESDSAMSSPTAIGDLPNRIDSRFHGNDRQDQCNQGRPSESRAYINNEGVALIIAMFFTVALMTVTIGIYASTQKAYRETGDRIHLTQAGTMSNGLLEIGKL